MKLPTGELGSTPALTAYVQGTAGVPYETITSLTNVQQLDKFSDQMALILQQNGGSLDLKTVPLP
jgi:hypothetical protein